MKFRIRKIAAIVLALTLSSTAWSDLIVGGPFDGTDVGGLDSVLDSTSDLSAGGSGCGPGSSPAAEECWAEFVIGGGVDLTLDGSTLGVAWYDTDGGNIAFQLVFGPGYYIVKNSTTWVLLSNNALASWGVLPGSLAATLGLGGEMQISHVTEFDGDECCNEVPEPGTLALLGLGLVGLGLTRRRKLEI